MKLFATKRYRFSAAHQLMIPHLSAEESEKIYGHCCYTHGHEYILEVTWKGAVNPDTGRILPTEIDQIIQEKLIQLLNHSFLNRNPIFKNIVPTGENILKEIWAILKPLIPGVELRHLRLFETRNNAFEYSGE